MAWPSPQRDLIHKTGHAGGPSRGRRKRGRGCLFCLLAALLVGEPLYTHPRAHPAVRLSVAGSAQVMVRRWGRTPALSACACGGGSAGDLRVWSAHVHNPPPWRPPFPSAAPQPSRHSPDSSGGSRAGRATASVLPRRPDRRAPGSRGNRVHVPPPRAQAAKSARGRRVAPLRQGAGLPLAGGRGCSPLAGAERGQGRPASPIH